MKKYKLLNVLLIILISLSLTGCDLFQPKGTRTLADDEEDTVSVTYQHITMPLGSQAISYYNARNFNYANTITKGRSSIKSDVKTVLEYGNIKISYSKMQEYYPETDKDPSNPDNMILFYSNISMNSYNITKNSKGEVVSEELNWNSNYNKEHVWPQSLGHDTGEPGGHDLYTVRPTYSSINSKRSNIQYGYAASVSKNYSTYRCYVNGVEVTAAYYVSTKVFEPMDYVKGDVARICFYYSLKYNFDLSIITTNINDLLEWNRLDPVSEIEINRNNVVQGIQGNRNIFVDYPDLADYIWG